MADTKTIHDIMRILPHRMVGIVMMKTKGRWELWAF